MAALTALITCGATAFAAAPHKAYAVSDTVALNEVSVTALSPERTRVGMDGSVAFGAASLSHVPRVLGESDALRFLQTLPGVTAASDYSAGVAIDGMGYAQNEYRLNGIPVHFPYHFGGVYSVFSPRLYDMVHVGKSIHGAGVSDVTGGSVDLTASMRSLERLEGEANVGMTASSAYVRLPLGKSVSVAASGRVSYIDAIYGRLLDDGQMSARYGFNDVDAVVDVRLSERDALRASFHHNADRVLYKDRAFSLETGLAWRNLLGGVEWRHEGAEMEAVNRVYYTGFENRLTLDMQSVVMNMPTSINEFGARGVFRFIEPVQNLDVAAGYGLRHYLVVPQWVDLKGFGVRGPERTFRLHATAVKLWGEAVYSPVWRWRFTAGAEVAGYTGADGYYVVDVDPRISAVYRWNGGNATAHFGRYHQALHQVGFSEMGMSSNFKLPASRSVPVQQSFNMVLAASHRPAVWLALSADAYYKRISNDPEYLGAVLDLLSPGYRAEDYVKVSAGYSAGFNLMARFEAGKVEGMAAYGYCHSSRHFPGGESFQASSALKHSATASATWHIGSGWSVAGVMNLASGRSYTPVTAIYFIGEKLMMEYGPRNSAHLPIYHRLDLSADYEFRTGGRWPLNHKVNLSVVNAYSRRNVEMSTFTVDVATGHYNRRDVSSLFRMLPSVSYTISF